MYIFNVFFSLGVEDKLGSVAQEKEVLEKRCKYLETNLKETNSLKYR